MIRQIAHITLVVADYDEAIDFYTKRMGFQLLEDTHLDPARRWVLVRPPGGIGPSLLLARAASEEQKRFIGRQTGGRVFLFLNTDDFEGDYQRLVRNGIRFVRKPADEAYGRVAVFEDLYGNLWDLIEPKEPGNYK